MPVSEYMSIRAVAEMLDCRPATIEDRIARGVYKERVHYFRPPGARVRFKREAIISWVEGGVGDTLATESKPAAGDLPAIPMARGYVMGQRARAGR